MHKQAFYYILFNCCLAVTITVITLITVPSNGRADLLPPPASFSAPEFEVDELVANIHGNQLVVNGKIRNKSFRTARGTVIIYLKDSGNGVITTLEDSVNKGDSFAHGEAGVFEASINSTSYSGLKSVFVEFVEQKQLIAPVQTSPIRTKPTTSAASPPVAGKVRTEEKIIKCKAKGGNWINNQCVVSLE